MTSSPAASLSAQSARSAPPGPWVRHNDAAGFSARIPQGWRVQASHWGDIAISEPLGSAAALVRTRRIAPDADFSRWVQDAYPATEPGLHSVRMLDVLACGPDLVRAAFDYGSQVFQGRAHVVAVREGDRAALFVAAAARAELVQRLPTLLQILDGLRFAAGPGWNFHERLRQCGLPWDIGVSPEASRGQR
ncbi:MAG: hypothetical protein ABL900_17545 [Burkholderiaceae bacterium]